MAATYDGPRSKVAETVRKAYAFAWRGDPKSAQDLLQNPGKDLWLSVGKAQILFSIAMGTGRDEDLATARTELDRAEKISVEVMEANKPDQGLVSVFKSFTFGESKGEDMTPEQRKKLWNYFSSLIAQAELTLNKLSLCIKERQWMTIGIKARSSWKFYEEAEEVWQKIKAGGETVLDEADRLEEIDVLSRLEFGIGLYHFFVSLVPPGLLLIVEAIGFEANRENGIKYLKSSVQREGIHYVTSSLLMVGYHNFFMQEDEPANKYIDHLLSKGYETAPAVRLMVGTVYRRQGRISDAINSYQMGMKGVRDQEQVTLILDCELGNTYFLDGNWEQAAALFDRFVTNTTNRQYKCFSMWKLGFCWWMMKVPNRDQKVKEINEKVIKIADDRFAYEKYSGRIAKRFLDRGKYTEFDELWLHAWSYNQASRFEDSTAILQKAVDVVKAQDESRLPLAMVECVGLCLYLKMSNFNGMDQLSDASESLQKLLKIQNEIVDELWVVPHAYVEMGELYLKRALKGVEVANMYKKARICFDRASSFSNFDFERPLSFRIARGRDLLRGAPA
eukprot:CAMPEP_0201523916 /NCGR_PEP_ID=MMETSP0161_2-20130828/20995_1 /ASSEMBLY_ACC=CAM_ASM_000251 /TAXON_ID=180227 /ORGANISM="Neoparamoeba aestuarina, Strain SoJaBio B1-5/56/2" /LENGTH=561 /DNA_ID=CAMNT_0047923149 /DNA_START=89 /DNA_END=1774 /DNA_ORIENTATION=-